jgi:heat shock protein 1/8
LTFDSYSCVGVWESERVEIIANEQGNRTTPSYVAFSDAERLVGDAAKNQAAMNPKNTVFDAKRLIGRRFDDPDVKADMKNWPFTVVEKETAPFIQVEFEGENKTYSPQGKKKNFTGFSKKLFFLLIHILYCRNLFHGPYQDEGNCRS